MGLIDRFTRDRVSKFVWSLAFIALAGLFAASLVMGSRARDAELGRAGDRAARQIGQLAQELNTFSLATELDGDAQTAAQTLADRIMADARVSAVRIWNTEADPMLVFSTEAGDPVGSREVENGGLISRAAAGGGAPLNIAAGEGDEATFHTYALIPDAVAEIEQAQAVVLADVNGTWGMAATATAIGAGVMLLLTILSFRPAVARINAGVPFAPENVPPGMSLIDADRLAAVNDVYALAQQRVDKLKERLQLSENERLFLQGELQRALSGFGPTTETPAPRHAAREPVAEAPADRPEPQPQRERAPEPSRPAKKQPRRKKEKAPAASSAEQPAEEALEPTPDAAEILAAAAEVGEVVEASSKAKPAEPEVEPEVAQIPEPEIVEIPEPEVVSLPESEVVATQPNEREAASVGAWSYPSVPEVAALKEDAVEEARDARELLDRLMATESHEIGGPDADPGRIREQIARVAAKKKPGGGEAKKLFTEPERPKPPWMRDRDDG